MSSYGSNVDIVDKMYNHMFKYNSRTQQIRDYQRNGGSTNLSLYGSCISYGNTSTSQSTNYSGITGGKLFQKAGDSCFHLRM